MEIEGRKKRKTGLLRGALHLQGLQVLFLGHLIAGIASLLHFKNPEKYGRKLQKIARKEGYEALDPDNGLYKTAQAMAEKSGIQLLHVFMKKNTLPENAAVSFDRHMAALYFDGDPRQIPVHGDGITEFIIGHELAHVKRKCNSHDLSMTANTVLLCPMVPFYTVASLLSRSSLVDVGLAMMAFSLVAGIPAINMMLNRNEEHLADIGSVHITGKPTDALIAMRYLQGMGEAWGEGGMLKHWLFNPYGMEHPSEKSRCDVLCEAFNIAAADRLQAEEIGEQLAQVMAMGPPCPTALRERRVA